MPFTELWRKESIVLFWTNKFEIPMRYLSEEIMQAVGYLTLVQSSLNFSPEFQTLTLYCLLSISTWVSIRHLRLNSYKIKLIIRRNFAPHTIFPVSVSGNSIFLVVLAKIFRLFPFTVYLEFIHKCSWHCFYQNLTTSYHLHCCHSSHHSLLPGLL